MSQLPDLSLQLYSVRAALAEDPAGTIGRLAAIGLTRVEPFALLRFADQLKGALADNGLAAPTTHQSLEGEDLELIFRTAAGLGVGTVIHPYSPPERWQSPPEIEQLADRLNLAAVRAREHGIRVAYHNHDWEVSTTIDNRCALEVFADQLDPQVLLEVDTYWAGTGGADIPALLRRLGSRVFALHLKDGPLNGNTAEQLPLGSGELPVAGIIAAATSLEFPVLEFDDYAGDIFAGISASYAYATGTLGAAR
jgi:sugar phosphate isomerase/epimerase